MYRLIVVDDEQLERQAIRHIVHTECPDIEVVGEADDGEKACAIARLEHPDIVLMDIRMPGVNGLEAMKMMRRELPEIKVIILTAFDEFGYAKEAVKLGAFDYLLKPVRPKELIRSLMQVAEEVRRDQEKRTQERSLRKQLSQAVPFIQMSYVYDLLNGSIDSMEEAMERATFLGVDFHSVVVLVIDIDDFLRITMNETELQKQICKQKVFETVCKSVGNSGMVTPFGSDKLVVLLNKEDGTDEDILTDTVRIAEKIRSSVAENLGITVTIGVGRRYLDIREAGKSYREALSAQRQSFFMGYNQVIHFDELPHLQSQTVIYPFQWEKAVLDKVRCGERKGAREALQKLLDEICIGAVSIDTVKAYILELVIVLSRAAVEGGANMQQLTLLNFGCINQLIECRSKEMIFEWLLASVDRFFDNMVENRVSVNGRLINKACEYIGTNCNKDLTLEETAQMVHMSPFYFSRIFKQSKGCNFIEYMTQARLDKAKKMLRESDMSIIQIASQVGYQDSSYFCRVFRKETGMTPNRYRKRDLQYNMNT